MDKMDEFKRPGVYILKFDPDNDDYSEKVYIGEGEPLKTRITQHFTDSKNEFKECVIVTSTRENELTKSHIKNMESKLFDLAISAKNAEIDNTNRPTKSSLSKAEEAIVDSFIDQIKIILPLCGFNCLIPTIAQDNINQNDVFKINKGNVYAEMIIDNNKYIVLKGAKARKETAQKYLHSCMETRNKLINNKDIVLDNDMYIFMENVIFNSSSQAASVVPGYNVSGLEEWINKNNKKKLKDC